MCIGKIIIDIVRPMPGDSHYDIILKISYVVICVTHRNIQVFRFFRGMWCHDN